MRFNDFVNEIDKLNFNPDRLNNFINKSITIDVRPIL